MIRVFAILYVVLHLTMAIIETVRYRRMYDYMSVKCFVLNEITFVSSVLLSVDLYAVCMGCLFGIVYLITGETVSL